MASDDPGIEAAAARLESAIGYLLFVLEGIIYTPNERGVRANMRVGMAMRGKKITWPADK